MDADTVLVEASGREVPITSPAKVFFAERVVRPQAGSIDFSGFDPILMRIDAVLDDYAKRKAAAPSLPTATVPRRRAAG